MKICSKISLTLQAYIPHCFSILFNRMQANDGLVKVSATSWLVFTPFLELFSISSFIEISFALLFCH